ncbi:hypothetical protein D9M70_544510 [compost metagenome]
MPLKSAKVCGLPAPSTNWTSGTGLGSGQIVNPARVLVSAAWLAASSARARKPATTSRHVQTKAMRPEPSRGVGHRGGLVTLGFIGVTSVKPETHTRAGLAGPLW